MSGIFGCGRRRNVAILAAPKPGLVAMLANGDASPVTSRWSAATTWQGSHHRRASRSPLWASAACTGCAMMAMARQQPMSFKLRLAAFMDHGPSNDTSSLNRFTVTCFALDQGWRTASALFMPPTWRHTDDTHCVPAVISHYRHDMAGSAGRCVLTF